jgi:hypothetical protein
MGKECRHDSDQNSGLESSIAHYVTRLSAFVGVENQCTVQDMAVLELKCERFKYTLHILDYLSDNLVARDHSIENG